MFEDYSLQELKTFRKQLAGKLLSNAGVGSFSLPDGVSVSLDGGNLKEVLRMLDDTIKRKEGRGSRFVSVVIDP